MKGLPRIIITHEGHTVMAHSAADARLIVESANQLIEATVEVTRPTIPQPFVGGLPTPTPEQIRKLMEHTGLEHLG